MSGWACLARVSSLLALALGMLPAHSVAQALHMDACHHTAWTVADGAPGQVTALAQSPDGFLWLATQSGVFRFDGVEFEHVVPPGAPFPSENAAALYVTRAGAVWIGFRYGMASVVDTQGIRHFDVDDGLPSGSVNGFAEDPEGVLWVSTWRGLARFDGQRWHPLAPEWGFPGRAHALHVDRAGTLWVAGETVLARLPQGARRFETVPMTVGRVSQIVEAPQGGVWIAESNGVVRSVPDGPTAGARTLWTEPSAGVLFDRHGSAWIPTLGEGVVQVPVAPQSTRPIQRYTQRQGLSADFLRAVLEDREGNLWFGSSQGLDRMRRSAMRAAPVPEGGQEFVIAAQGDALWLGSRNRPLQRLHQGVLHDTGGPAALTAALQLEDVVWLGGEAGLWQLRDGQVRQVAGLPAAVGHSGVQALAADGEGGVWASLNRPGLYRWQEQRWTHALHPAYPVGASPLVLHTDAEGALWLGFAHSRLVRQDARGVLVLDSTQGLRVGHVTVLAACAGQLCIGGDAGLAWYDGRTVHPVLPGHPLLRGITGLTSDGRGQLWVHGAAGVVRLPETALANAQALQAGLRAFDHLDGVSSAPAQLRPLRTAVRAEDGRIWFAGAGSIYAVDPDQLPHNPLPPPVLIRRMYIDEQPQQLPLQAPLPATVHTLRIDYTALALGMPERVRYRYRLEGLDKDWQNAGSRRLATYTNPGPGEFRFRVEAANEDGVWSLQPAELAFTIAPRFYQTHGFVLGCLALAALWVRWLWRRRLGRERQRLHLVLQGRLAERERIARELHDTLLQGIQGLLLRFQAIGDRLPASDPLRQRMDAALDRAEAALVEGRAQVQGLRTPPGAGDLQHAVLQACELQEGDGSPVLQVWVDGTVRILAAGVQMEVLRVVREAVLNACQHASARRIDVELLYARRHFSVTVRDDGQGFEPAAALRRPGHYGLRGLQERAAGLGGRLQLWSQPRMGSVVRLRIPARTAYGAEHRALRWRFWR